MASDLKAEIFMTIGRRKIIVNSNSSETRVALTEDDVLVEIHIERHAKANLVGRIYKAKVSRVLPGMQSAFINIGTDRAAFLYGGDVLDAEFVRAEEKRRADLLRQGVEEDTDIRRVINRRKIEDLLKAGDEVLVQVAKEPLGSKGPRVTMLITIPGRYLVLMPDMNAIGISRRIEDEVVREGLRETLMKIKPDNVGVIVRTAAAGVDPELIKKDLEYLIFEWQKTKQLSLTRPAPELLYQEPDIVLKVLRDLYSEEVESVIVDSPTVYSQIRHFLLDTIPGAGEKLLLFDKPGLIFDEYGIEVDIASALNKKVWLPSGGYLIIDQTEALTAFDVNSGKYVGSRSLKDTILKTNLEAAEEVARQLRLRNIGGIIIIDFIDMDDGKDREKLNESMMAALEADKAKTNVLAVNDLGLVQLTRKRTAESIERVLTDPCPTCEGKGRTLSTVTRCLDLCRDIERMALKTGNSIVKVRCDNSLKDHLENEEHLLLDDLEKRLEIKVLIEVASDNSSYFSVGGYEILE
jgi:ribonuclease G